jgi:hypothetical protein
MTSNAHAPSRSLRLDEVSSSEVSGAFRMASNALSRRSTIVARARSLGRRLRCNHQESLQEDPNQPPPPLNAGSGGGLVRAWVSSPQARFAWCPPRWPPKPCLLPSNRVCGGGGLGDRQAPLRQFKKFSHGTELNLLPCQFKLHHVPPKNI